MGCREDLGIGQLAGFEDELEGDGAGAEAAERGEFAVEERVVWDGAAGGGLIAGAAAAIAGRMGCTGGVAAAQGTAGAGVFERVGGGDAVDCRVAGCECGDAFCAGLGWHMGVVVLGE